jgi:YidC/Oxa1 family membrane protein insertase
MVREKYNASMTGMIWPFVQIPFSFGLFRIINGMTHIPVPSLEDAGFLWFHDLTVADPFYLLPAMGTGFLVTSLLVSYLAFISDISNFPSSTPSTNPPLKRP